MQNVRSSLPRSERDAFVVKVMQNANGQLVEARDALLALMTVLDLENLARQTGQGAQSLVDARNAARLRLLRAIEDGA